METSYAAGVAAARDLRRWCEECAYSRGRPVGLSAAPTGIRAPGGRKYPHFEHFTWIVPSRNPEILRQKLHARSRTDIQPAERDLRARAVPLRCTCDNIFGHFWRFQKLRKLRNYVIAFWEITYFLKLRNFTYFGNPNFYFENFHLTKSRYNHPLKRLETNRNATTPVM